MSCDFCILFKHSIMVEKAAGLGSALKAHHRQEGHPENHDDDEEEEKGCRSLGLPRQVRSAVYGFIFFNLQAELGPRVCLVCAS